MKKILLSLLMFFVFSLPVLRAYKVRLPYKQLEKMCIQFFYLENEHCDGNFIKIHGRLKIKDFEAWFLKNSPYSYVKVVFIETGFMPSFQGGYLMHGYPINFVVVDVRD